MIKIHNRIGRLIEIRLEGRHDPVADPPPPALPQDKSGAPPVLCVDLRRAALLAPEVARHMIAALRTQNGQAERVAWLIPADNAVMGMQAERVLREAGDPSRQVFRTPAEAEAWLGEVLLPAERARLRTFLAHSGE